MAETDQLGIGILGAASIAKKNCRAIAKTRTGVGRLLSATPCSIGTSGRLPRAARCVHAVKLQNFSHLPAVVVAVGSRSFEKAQAFIQEVGATSAKAYSSYEAVLQDSKVHAVYVPLPTSLHLEWVKKVAAAGKHILLEKPIAAVSLLLVTQIHDDVGVICCQVQQECIWKGPQAGLWL